MSADGPRRYVVYGGAGALAVGILLLGLALSQGVRLPPWALFGWLLASASGVACGARLTALHGTQDAAFLVALGTCMLARLVAFAGFAGWAVSRSYEDALAFVAGLVAGYLPTQVFELAWFAGRAGKDSR